ncbi:MAG: ATP-binding protein [Calditrichaeota bacterium]|nr:ATP-binding protein [Calditrichota bacterium]
MIMGITIRRFKGIEELSIPLDDVVIFAGPNNSHKTTALQALVMWQRALQKWYQKRGRSKGTKKIGVALARTDLVTSKSDIRGLWFDKQVYLGVNDPSKIEIIVDGINEEGNEWNLGMELQFSSDEQLIVRPIRTESNFDLPPDIPQEALNVKIVHLPALAGIPSMEDYLGTDSQDRYVEEGRGGDVLRSIIYDLHLQHWNTQPKGRKTRRDYLEHSKWGDLQRILKRFFGVELLEPEKVGGQLWVWYKQLDSGRNNALKLEITSAGSGFLQTLLIFAYLNSREGKILLLDEPDAHLEWRKQEEIYNELKELAKGRKSQLIVSSHSEVIINQEDRQTIVCFPQGRPLIEREEVQHLRRLLREVPTVDIIELKRVAAILYCEDFTDREILLAWANKCNLMAAEIIQNIHFHPIGGNSIAAAKRNFEALRLIYSNIKGFIIVDRLERGGSPRSSKELFIRTWKRREIENYLLVPNALARFCRLEGGEMFGQKARELLEGRYFTPEAIGNPMNDSIHFLYNYKASDEILNPFFREYSDITGRRRIIAKHDYHKIAACMEESELHADIIETLNQILHHFA